MSGHSKWATTKRQKAVTDAKRSAAFTKVANIITIASRKGSDPETNFSLRVAIEKAKAVNMPKDNIQKAIARGSGESGINTLDELTYEGIGPNQIQFILKCLTNNKNRTAAEIRHLFSKYGGALGNVLWNFAQLGVITISRAELEAKKINLDDFELELIDQGAKDIKIENEGIIIYTETSSLQQTKSFLDAKSLAPESLDIEFVPKELIALKDSEAKENIEKFIDEIEENEDISNYYTNYQE